MKHLRLLLAGLLLASPAMAEDKTTAPTSAVEPPPAVQLPLASQSAAPPDTSSMLFVQNLRKAGATIYYLGEALGLHGWFAVKDGQVQIFYTTPDQKALLVGALLTADGANLSQQQVVALASSRPEIQALLKGETPPSASTVSPSVSAPESGAAPPGGAEKFFAELQGGATVTLGSPKAPQVLIIMDINCTHCHQAWKMLAPLVEKNKLRVTLFPIVALGAASQKQTAVWLSQKDPADAWKQFMAGNEKIFQTGEADPAKSKAVADNTLLIQKWKVDQTPYLLYRGKNGKIRLIVGEPKSADVITGDIGG